MNSPILAVGIGNTTVRLAVAAPGLDWPVVWLRHLDLPINEFEPAHLAKTLPDTASAWFVSSVNRPVERRLIDWVAEFRRDDTLAVVSPKDLPIQVAVAAAEQVGVDRLVAAVSVDRLRRPQAPAVVIDAGTAVTVDWLDASSTFCGGIILPGVKAMAHALASNTDLLPEIDVEFSASPPTLIGQSTVAAIRSGLFYGTIGAIHELVGRYQSIHTGPPAQVFLTGGDAHWLTRTLEIEHTVVGDLGLQGIVAVAQAIRQRSAAAFQTRTRG